MDKDITEIMNGEKKNKQKVKFSGSSDSHPSTTNGKNSRPKAIKSKK